MHLDTVWTVRLVVGPLASGTAHFPGKDASGLDLRSSRGPDVKFAIVTFLLVQNLIPND